MLAPEISKMPPLFVMLPAPLKLPLKVILLLPPIVEVPEKLNPLPRVVVKLDCKVPPFNASAPVPNAFVATPICKVPFVKVVAPEYELLLPPETINVPVLAFSVMLPAPLKLPPKVVMALLVSLKVPLVKVPVPLRAKLLLPLIAVLPAIVKLLASVAPTVACKLPPFNASAPVPNAFVATPICKVPLVKVVVPE